MNIRKLFTAFGLTMFAFVLGQAQENKTFHYSEASIAESKIELSDEWKTTVIDNVVSIYNGNIQNNSNKTVHNLKLELILSPINSDVSHGVLTGYYLTEAQFKNIRKNSKLAGVNITNSLETSFPLNGTYLPLLILTDSRGSVLDFKSLNETQIISKDGTFSIALPEVEEPIMEVPHQESMTEVKITMNEDNSVILGKDWKIDIDFKNFKVNLTGGEISNLRPKEVKNTKIDVFLTKENQDIITKDFSGLRIASANLERSLEGHTKMIDTNVTTDLLQIPPQGTYYILLTLSIIDDEGNWSVKNKRAFTETITL